MNERLPVYVGPSILAGLILQACFAVRHVDPGAFPPDGSPYDAGALELSTAGSTDQAFDGDAIAVPDGGDDDAAAPAPAVRLIAPLSTATVTSQRPTLRWTLGSGVDGAHVQLCRDRACGVTVSEFDVVGTSTSSPVVLSAGVMFWRAYPRRGSVTEQASTPVWQFTVGARSAPVDTAWGTTLDVNGDGFADVVIGAPDARLGLGHAHLYLGSASGLPDKPSAILYPPDASTSFGASVNGAGDVNGDGFADLLVRSGDSAERAYLYLGSTAGLSSLPSLRLFSGDASVLTASFASAGDVNGDGYSDVVVGTSGADRVVGIYLGSAMGLPPAPSSTQVAVKISNSSVFAMVGAGDVNGDGFSDVFTRVYSINPGTLERTGVNRMSVYEGGALGLTIPSLPFATSDLVDSTASAGDVNGDRYGDVLVGSVAANGNTLRGTYAGGAFAYLGHPAGLLAAPSTSLEGPDGDASNFGGALASAGDVNGDGYADVVIGASWTDTDVGRAHLYLGGPNGLSMAMPPLTLTGPGGPTRFGAALASPGDVNGDGFADVLIGAPDADDEAGRVYLYLGSPGGLSVTPSAMVAGPDGRGGHFGASLAGAN